MSVEKMRLNWIDYVKGFCMMVIILNHIPGPKLIGCLTYPFELFGFFFVAGYTLSLKYNARDFLINKIKRLLIPIFSFGLINTFLTYIMLGSDLKERVLGVFVQNPGHWDDMWFVSCLFVMLLIMYIILKYINKRIFRIITILSISVIGWLYIFVCGIPIPWHIANACALLPILYAGYCFKHLNNAQLKHAITQKKIYICAVCIFVGSCLIFPNYPIDIHLLNYGDPFIFMIQSTTGLIALIITCMYLERFNNIFVLKWVSFIGINSLIYYGLQSKAITAGNMIVDHFYQTPVLSSVHSLFIWVISLTILIIPVIVINRYLPFLVGNFRNSIK